MAKERHREKEKKRDRKAETLNHRSIHQWVRSAIFAPHQLTSPIGFPFLKLAPPPCAVLLVGYHIGYHRTIPTIPIQKSEAIWKAVRNGVDEFSECLTESGLYQACIRLFVAPVAPAQDVAMAVMSRVAGLSRS